MSYKCDPVYFSKHKKHNSKDPDNKFGDFPHSSHFTQINNNWDNKCYKPPQKSNDNCDDQTFLPHFKLGLLSITMAKKSWNFLECFIICTMLQYNAKTK